MIQSLLLGEFFWYIFCVYFVRFYSLILLAGICRTNYGCSGTHREKIIEESRSWADGTGLSFFQKTEKSKIFFHSVVFGLKKQNHVHFPTLSMTVALFCVSWLGPCGRKWLCLRAARSTPRRDLGRFGLVFPLRYPIVCCSWGCFCCW